MAEESKNLSKADKPVIDIKGLWSEEETASKTNNMSKVQKLLCYTHATLARF